MTLWLILALLTVAVVAILLRPLLGRGGIVAARADYDRMVFRDQLSEVDRDVERGLISADQAGAARLEIQRRVLAAGDGAESRLGIGTTTRRVTALALAVVVPLGAFGLYTVTGAPDLPAQPFAERQQQRLDMPGDQAQQMIALVERLAEKLRTDPDNAQGWAMLGRSYRALGRHAEAADAYGQAVARGEADVDLLGDWGETLTLAANGPMPAQAVEAFQQVVRADPAEPRALFYLGSHRLDADDPKGAVAIWRHLEAHSPEGSAWLPVLRERIAEIAKQAGFDPASVPAEAPALPADLPPVGMSPDEGALIRTMVANLAERLRDAPNDGEGWAKLGKSYRVLGQTAESRDAYARAMALRPDDAPSRLGYASALLALSPDGGIPPGAEKALREALALAPDDPDALYFVGLAAAQKGDMAEARTLWGKLAAQMPEDSEARADLQKQIDMMTK
ncbi:MAG: c-type cytochrome biogenesis protein CcmI [Alphaproteobacteria bacterium]|nr:c-type cytochrome biogenesis protein CcmI [Alphaproteobacteria bacterium]